MPDRSTIVLRNFADLLAATHAQARPQRLLLVFAVAELPQNATGEHQARFERGEGGALTPVVCVDKDPKEIADFAQLCAEEQRTEKDWDMLFVGALAGRNRKPATPEQVDDALRKMVEQIRGGHVSPFLAVDRSGVLVKLEAA